MRTQINEKEYLNITQHSGKMEGVPSISTNKLLNENCRKLMNSKNENCICKHCFVDGVMNRYNNVEQALTHNTNIITKRILTKSEIEKLGRNFLNTLMVRFESFGDLNNEIQLINYVNLAKFCKRTSFALFTKHFSIVLKYLKAGNKLPKNVTLVLSSPLMNHGLTELLVEKFKNYHDKVITFTVTTDKTNKNINCGKRKCIDCRNCYDSKKPHDVIELIK